MRFWSTPKMEETKWSNNTWFIPVSEDLYFSMINESLTNRSVFLKLHSIPFSEFRKVYETYDHFPPFLEWRNSENGIPYTWNRRALFSGFFYVNVSRNSSMIFRKNDYYIPNNKWFDKDMDLINLGRFPTKIILQLYVQHINGKLYVKSFPKLRH